MSAEFQFSPRPNRAHEIAWSAWSEEPFARAASESKPILLAISAVWCHWCHVMDETSYSDSRVIDAINARFVPVRVDNDRRPDINARYNMGGWPTTAFLTPDGTTIAGATYLPPEQMRRTLEEIASLYAERKTEIEAHAVDLRSRRTEYRPAAASALNMAMVEGWFASVAEGYDHKYGGFGDAPKFPHVDLLQSLLTYWQATGEPRALEMVVQTMRGMAGGGMYDHVEGGFFRYSTTRDWSVPHFEKMSEDHAGLLRVLAGLVLDARCEDLRPTLLSSAAYVRDVLRDPQTGFFAGSQDADEEYFALQLEARRERTAPYVDRTAYTNWTAALAGAGCAVARALEAPGILERALFTLDRLHAGMLDADGLAYHFALPGGAPQVRGLLTDQVAYLRGMLDAYEYAGEGRFLTRAIALADAVERHFAAPDGGFFDRAPLEPALGRLELPDRPIVEGGNLADSLLRLAALTGNAAYRRSAEGILCLYASTYAAAGTFAATYARALHRYLAAETVVRIVGQPAETTALRAAAGRLPSPFVAVATLDPAAAAAAGLPPDPGVAYLCSGTACGPPLREPPALRAAFEKLASPETPPGVRA